jgi:Carboxypeptidase regulatory-like domain
MTLSRSLILRCTLVFFVSCCLSAAGQVLKGSISGTIADAQGAVISGARVVATDVATGSKFSTTTSTSGLFKLSLLPVGTYKVEVGAQGFRTAVINNVAVVAAVDSSLRPVNLNIGEASSSVDVSTDRPLLSSNQAQVTHVFSGTLFNNFAGIKENEGLDNMALFVPGVTSSRDNNFANTNGGRGFAVNGLRGRFNDQQIDGQNNNDNSVTGPALQLASSEFVSEYVLISNNFGPEFGRNSGSVVNLMTKSGTNDWHGSVFLSENNSILNSLTSTERRFGDLTTVKIRTIPHSNDEMGGFTVGGPWVKNKVFFFGGFDQEIINRNSIFLTSNIVPTTAGIAALQGCFPSGAAADAVNAVAKFGPFAISKGNPQPVAPRQGVVPLCLGAQFAGVQRTLSTPRHFFNWVARTDVQLGADTISSRYIFQRDHSINFDPGGGLGAAGYPIDIPVMSQAVLLSWTHQLTPRMMNESRVSFERLNAQFGGNSLGTVPTLEHLTEGTTSVFFNAGGLQMFGPNSDFPQGRIVNTWQFQDNWNELLGAHQLKAGANYTYQRSPTNFMPAINAVFIYPSWARYFLGAPSQDQIALGTSVLDFREHDTFLYFGDDWKIRQNFSLNMGLTWSYYGQPGNIFNDIDVARESNPNTLLFNSTLPLSIRSSPRLEPQRGLFGPSLGFAYAPHWGGFLTGNDKTVIRGGYRLQYDPAFYNIYLNMATSAPQVFRDAIRLGPPVPASMTSAAARAALAPFIQLGQVDPRALAQQTVAPDFRPDTVHSWSLGIEREISRQSVLELRYTGNRARDLFQNINANPFILQLKKDFPNVVPAGLTPCTTPDIIESVGFPVQFNPAFGRVDCKKGAVLEVANTGYSDHHAAQVEFRSNNLFRQLTVRTGYTFSKTTDNTSEIFGTAAINGGVGAGNTMAMSQNPFSFTDAEHGTSGLDFPHVFTVAFTEELPFFRQQHGLLGHVLGGWSISGNYLLASGQPYTPVQRFLATCTNPASPPNGIPPNNCFVPGQTGDYFDELFFSQLNNGLETARPFLANPSAPVSSVGIYAGDACVFGLSLACNADPNQLVSFNALQNTALPQIVNVSQGDVRFIANTFRSQRVFGTPFGNVGRNTLRDAISNIGNLSVAKQFKFSERVNFTFRTTFLNALNHANFLTVDPFIDDAGLLGVNLGFADPTVTDDVPRGTSANRRIFFSGTLRF